MSDRIPEVWWDPSRLAGTKPLNEEGELPGSPFAALPDALAAVDKRRAQKSGSSPGDNVYLITWEPRGSSGWVVYEYSEMRAGKADLDELKTSGLPLGGSIDDPRTYVVDARNVLGRLVREGAGPGYLLKRIERDAAGNPPAPPVYLPAYVPEVIENHGGNIEWFPQVVLRPGASIAELAEALGWIHANMPTSVVVKAGGSRHSWSPVCTTDGVYVRPEGMRGKPPITLARESDFWLRSGVDPSHLVRVLSGTTLRTINATLWAKGLALPVLGGYDGQTIGGVLPTGTHGSVLKSGPITEIVRSVDLIQFDGKIVRLEPRSKAITDPQAFREHRPDWELVQDDDDFGAVLISMGTMGVVHSLVLEVVDRFWLTEVRTMTTMPEAEKVLRGGNIYHLMESQALPNWIDPVDGRMFTGHPKPAFHEEFLWNPYTDKVLITSRHPVDEAQAMELARNEPAFFANPPVRNLLRALRLDAMADEYSRPDIQELGTEYLNQVLDDVVESVAKIHPKLLPVFIDNAITGLADEEYTQRSYHVFNIGDGANRIPAQSGTISVPLRDDMYLEAMHIIREVARDLAERERKYQTGPTSLRFVRGAPNIPLADPEDTCKFEVIFGGDSARVMALSRDVFGEFYHALYARFGAHVRLHWGQLVPDGTLTAPGKGGALRVRESYPQYDKWRTIRDRYDPAGRGLNAWLREVMR